LGERCSAELKQIFNKIDIYMQRRGEVPLLDILQPYSGVKYDPKKEDVSLHDVFMIAHTIDPTL
jgi:hypothetical protein